MVYRLYCSLSILCTGCACQLIIKENDDDDDDDSKVRPVEELLICQEHALQMHSVNYINRTKLKVLGLPKLNYEITITPICKHLLT